MVGNIKEHIFSYAATSERYYVTRREFFNGTQIFPEDRFFLTRVSFANLTTIQIRIKPSVMDKLAVLDNVARITLSEKLITDKIYQLCQVQFSRESPATAT